MSGTLSLAEMRPVRVAIGKVDSRQETAGHACYESTAKRAKPPLRAALMTQQSRAEHQHTLRDSLAPWKRSPVVTQWSRKRTFRT